MRPPARSPSMKSPPDILVEGVREGVYPGGQLAASREGARLFSGAAGIRGPGLERTHEHVIYDLASLTKPLSTTVLLGQAFEYGLCSLDDPLDRYVPEAPSDVTLEHVLEHGAGFIAHQRFDQRLPSSIVPASWKAWRHIVREAARAPRLRPPGEKAEYSDIGFILLGAVLERLRAQPLSTAHGLLGTPLCFRDRRGPPATPPIEPKFPIAPTEHGLVGEVHDENARAMGGAAGHAGLFGTAEGVLAVAEDLISAYHGEAGCLLQPETIRRLWQPSRVPDSTRTLGWDRPSSSGSSTGGRWPRHAVGHLGFTGTSLWVEPDRALAVVLVTNRVCPSRANNRIRTLRPALYSAAWEAWARPHTRSPRVSPSEERTLEDPPRAPSTPGAQEQ